MEIPVMGFVTVSRTGLLRKALGSIDCKVGKLVIVDNGGRVKKDGEMVEKIEKLGGVVLEHGNVGCAGAWNEIIKGYPADWWMLANDDVVFCQGELAKMAKMAESGAYSVVGNCGASWWAVTEKGIGAAGTFDENLWPAYYEDVDWERRANLVFKERGGAGTPCVVLPGCKTAHLGGASLQGKEVREAVFRRNWEYMRRKWGQGPPWKSQRPFGDGNWPLWAWKYDSKRREDLRRELIPMGVAP